MPFPSEDDLSHESLLKAVIKYYFNPILCQDLVVVVSDDNISTVVDLDNVFDILDTIEWSISETPPKEMCKMFELAQGHRTLPDRDRIQVAPSEVNRAPTPVCERLDDGILSDIRERFDRQEILAFRIPVWVYPRDEETTLSYFDLMIQKDTDLQRTHSVYVRNNLTIPHAGTGGGGGPTVRAFLIVGDPPLAKLLRDAEEPSHSKWNSRSQKVRDDYRLGPSTVSFINRALGDVIRCLTISVEGVYRDILQEYFSIPEPRKVSPPPPLPPPPPPPSCQIVKGADGFVIRLPDYDQTTNQRYHVRVAYQIRRGNPLKRYDPRDFRLDSNPVTIQTHNSTYEVIASNQVIIQPLGVDPRVTIDGFDTNRDLYIRVDPEE